MATQVVPARILDLEEHGRRLLELYIEPLLGDDIAGEPVRRTHEVGDRGLYEHLWQALELWQRLRGLPDAV
jgi:hypothetical protein